MDVERPERPPESWVCGFEEAMEEHDILRCHDLAAGWKPALR